MLAKASEADGKEVLAIAERLQTRAADRPAAFESELEDLQTWAYLSLYLAEKLRGGVALETFRRSGVPKEKEEAIECLERAAEHWDGVVRHTQSRYQEVPYIDRPRTGYKLDFAWHHYRDQVKRDLEIARAAEPRSEAR